MTTPSSATAATGLDRRFELLGTTIAVAVRGSAAAARVARIDHLLAPFGGRPPGAVPCSFTVTVTAEADGTASLARAGQDTVEGTWRSIEAHLLMACNALAIGGYEGLAVHGGVVATGARVVCFPGRSGAGKSTITAACLRRGFAYVSDEALCIDRTTRAVEPYPRPLALSRRSCQLVGFTPEDPARGDEGGAEREHIVTAGDLGATVVAATGPSALTDIVELHRGATEPHLESVHRSRAVPALLSMAFNHFKDPDASVEVVGALARDVRVWRLHYDDPLAAGALLARSMTS